MLRPWFTVKPPVVYDVRVSLKVTIIHLTPSEVETLYSHRFATIEFFPRDIALSSTTSSPSTPSSSYPAHPRHPTQFSFSRTHPNARTCSRFRCVDAIWWCRPGAPTTVNRCDLNQSHKLSELRVR